MLGWAASVFAETLDRVSQLIGKRLDFRLMTRA
jgi:hypothetical protein